MNNEKITEIFKNFTGLLFRGLKEEYDPNNKHLDKIYFCTDTKEILLNNENYSGIDNIYVIGDITLLSNESADRIIQILGNKNDIDFALNNNKIIVSITSFGVLPIEVIKLSFTEYLFTIRFYNLHNIQNRTITINCDNNNWLNIKSINIINLINDVDNNKPTSLFIKNENGTIKGEISLDYDNENKIIKLLGFNKEIISSIDATSFIKDGMINNVQLEKNPDGKPIGTYLVITFNTDAGKEPIYLNITKLIGIYTAGQGIDILDNTISIKIDPSSEKYIVVTKDGLKIAGIDEKFNFTPTTKINKLIGEIQITNELEHDKQELFDLFGVDNVNSLFSLSPEATVKYFEDAEGNILNYVVNGGISAGQIDLFYKNILFDGRILQGSISVLGRKDSYGIYTAISSITETKSENDLAFSNHIEWGSSSNMNNYTNPGLYVFEGLHSNSGDNLPITAYANGNVGGFLIVTESSITSSQDWVIGQTLILSNRVGEETKQFIRSCIVKERAQNWTPWKEVNTIQIFGEKSDGIATKANIDAAIDNGQYAGVYMDTDGFLPQGATFTLTVVNNYAANAASSLPSNNRQITQIFTYTPLSLTGTINKSNIVKRDGIGESTITWGKLENVTDNPIYYVGDIFSLSTSSTSDEIEKVLGSVNDFTNAYKKGKLIVCATNISENNNSTISPILFQYYEDTIKIKMIYAGLEYNSSSPDDCIEIDLNKNSNTWRVTNVIKQKLNDYSDIQNKVTALEGKASEVYENYDAIERSGETNVSKIYIDGKTMQPYIYKGGSFVPFKGGEETKVFRDVNTSPLFYFKDGLFFYGNNKGTLCSWNEETDEVVDYGIRIASHPYNISANFPFIYRDGKIIVPTSKGATCYNLETKEELWSITIAYYSVIFNEYKGFIYLQDFKNKSIIKLISIEDGSTIQEFNLSELSGETSNIIQDFGECEINGYCYFSNDIGHIFKISNENGYIEHVGKIDGVKNISFNNGYVFMLGDSNIFSADKTVFEDGTLITKNNKKHIQDTYLESAIKCKIINGTFYTFKYKISISSIFYGNYIYETLDMSYEGRGKAIKGNKGYVMIKDSSTTNEKPFYVKYDWL